MSKIHNIKTLPRWARDTIIHLKHRVEHAELTIPYTKPGMEWFTLFHPDARPTGDIEDKKLFLLSKSGAHLVCTIGPNDCMFIGRGKK